MVVVVGELMRLLFSLSDSFAHVHSDRHVQHSNARTRNPRNPDGIWKERRERERGGVEWACIEPKCNAAASWLAVSLSRFHSLRRHGDLSAACLKDYKNKRRRRRTLIYKRNESRARDRCHSPLIHITRARKVLFFFS